MQQKGSGAWLWGSSIATLKMMSAPRNLLAPSALSTNAPWTGTEFGARLGLYIFLTLIFGVASCKEKNGMFFCSMSSKAVGSLVWVLYALSLVFDTARNYSQPHLQEHTHILALKTLDLVRFLLSLVFISSVPSNSNSLFGLRKANRVHARRFNVFGLRCDFCGRAVMEVEDASIHKDGPSPPSSRPTLSAVFTRLTHSLVACLGSHMAPTHLQWHIVRCVVEGILFSAPGC